MFAELDLKEGSSGTDLGPGRVLLEHLFDALFKSLGVLRGS
jgi:hypothetical protein